MHSHLDPLEWQFGDGPLNMTHKPPHDAGLDHAPCRQMDDSPPTLPLSMRYVLLSILITCLYLSVLQFCILFQGGTLCIFFWCSHETCHPQESVPQLRRNVIRALFCILFKNPSFSWTSQTTFFRCSVSFLDWINGNASFDVWSPTKFLFFASMVFFYFYSAV